MDRSRISEIEYKGFRMGFWESFGTPKTRKHGNYMNKFSTSTKVSQLLWVYKTLYYIAVQ